MISCWLYSLSSQLFLELQSICIISKIDLISTYGEGDLPLDFFTGLEDFSALKMLLESKGYTREKDPDQTDFVISSYDCFRQKNPNLKKDNIPSPIFVKIIWKLLDMVESHSKTLIFNTLIQ